jgi:pimeloyl-ACP methyl ester carboxylesterase
MLGKGVPLVYFHGTASSRLEISLLAQFAEDHGFRLVGIDRPGYGQSTYQPASFRGFAQDVNAVVDRLGLGRFAVLSWSGGGPFALTYITLNSDRVTHAVAAGCPALPFDPAVAHNNNRWAKVAMKNRYAAKLGLRMFRRSILKANQDIPAYLVSRSGRHMVAGWSAPDVQFFADPTWLKTMYTAMAEGFRQPCSVDAIYNEHSLFLQPWTEPVWQIPAGKLTLWQGAQDKTCPADCAEKIAQTIKGAQVAVFHSLGHCVLFAEPKKLAVALGPLKSGQPNKSAQLYY